MWIKFMDRRGNSNWSSSNKTNVLLGRSWSHYIQQRGKDSLLKRGSGRRNEWKAAASSSFSSSAVTTGIPAHSSATTSSFNMFSSSRSEKSLEMMIYLRCAVRGRHPGDFKMTLSWSIWWILSPLFAKLLHSLGSPKTNDLPSKADH